MRNIHAVVALAIVVGAPARANDQAISLSVSPAVVTCSVGDSVTLEISLTNNSSTPRYLHSDLALTLDYAVKDASGAVVRRFNDPPLFGRLPQHSNQRVWLNSGDHIRFDQRLSLAELGIQAPGAYTLVAFWAGDTKTESQLESESIDTSFSHSGPVKLLVSSRGSK